ncbi:MAG: hypothetical protein AB1782_13490 [Cyanobacteriota bacterium]
MLTNLSPANKNSFKGFQNSYPLQSQPQIYFKGFNNDSLRSDQISTNVLKAYYLSKPTFKGNDSLNKNLEIARETVDYVKSLNLISSTELELKGQLRGEDHENYQTSIQNRMFLDRKRRNLPINEFISKTVEMAPLLHTGNCAEQAIIAAHYLKETKGINNFALIAAIEVSEPEAFKDNPLKYGYNANNHVFVVMDLAPDAILNDPSTWGKNAVIVDPWGKIVAPANNSDPQNNGVEKVKSLPIYKASRVQFMNYAPFIDPSKDSDSSYNWENYQKNLV